MRTYQFKYVDRFKCDGSKCDAKCCKNWTINIDQATYNKYRHIKNISEKTKILSSIKKIKDGKGYFIKLNEEWECPLICKDKLCYIQRVMGEDYLSVVCQTYPRKAIVLGNCQLRSLSMTCPVAAEEALFTADGMTLEIKDSLEDSSSWNLLLKDLHKSRLQDTKGIDSTIVGSILILQNKEFTREERMVLLGLYLDRIDEIGINDNTADNIINIAMKYQTREFHIEARKILSNFSFRLMDGQQVMKDVLHELAKQNQIGALQDLLQQVDDYAEMHKKWHSAMEAQYGQVIDNFWLQEFFHHGYPFKFERSLLENYFVYILSYKLWEHILYGFVRLLDHIMQKDAFILAVNTYSKIMDHRSRFVPILNEKAAELTKEPLNAMQMLLKVK